MRNRRRSFAFLAILLAFAGAHRPAQAQEAHTIVILVRHAEKAATPADDPGLTAEGQARADRLARLLADARVQAVYATQFQRTILTARPLADRLGQEVRIAPVQGSAEAFARTVADAIVQDHTGQTVLIVSHSNTVPLIAKALGAPDPGPIADDEYSHLFVVTISADGKAGLIRSTF